MHLHSIYIFLATENSCGLLTKKFNNRKTIKKSDPRKITNRFSTHLCQSESRSGSLMFSQLLPFFRSHMFSHQTVSRFDFREGCSL